MLTMSLALSRAPFGSPRALHMYNSWLEHSSSNLSLVGHHICWLCWVDEGREQALVVSKSCISHWKGNFFQNITAVTILFFLFFPSCCARCFLLSPGILSACCSRPLTSWGLYCCHPIWLPTWLSCLFCWVKKLGKSWASWGWRAEDCCFQSWGGNWSWVKLRGPTSGWK